MPIPLALPHSVLLERARAWLRQREFYRARINARAAPSAETVEQYRKTVARLFAKGSREGCSPAELMAAYDSLVRWHKHAGALRWHCASVIAPAIASIDARAQFSTAASSTRDGQDLEAIAIAMAHLDGLRPPLCAEGKRRRKSARRAASLPANWRERLIEKTAGADRSALLLFALSGCRPIELAQGIVCRVSRMSADPARISELSLDIPGAKCRSGFGQRMRTLIVTINDTEVIPRLLAETLFDASKTTAGDSRTLSMATARLGYQVRRAAHALWPETRAHVTPYSFRYAFRQDCARRNMSSAETAVAMGHQVRYSSLAYGMTRRRIPALASMGLKGTVAVRELEDGRRGRGRDLKWQLELDLARDLDRRQDAERQLALDLG